MDDQDKGTPQEIDGNQEEEQQNEQVQEQPEQPQEQPQPEVQETTEEQQEPEQEPTESEEEPTQEEKRRENLRIQSVISKLQQQGDTKTPQQPNQGMDYKQALKADDEVYQKLEQDRQMFGQQQYQQGVKQAETVKFHTRLELDAPKVESKYPQLDKNSNEFNPAAANAINQWYLTTVGYDARTDTVQNSDVRYADFVEGIMELADEMAGQKAQESSKNIAKQAANTGIRPDGSKAKGMNLNKAPGDMTDEELDAVIGSVLPKK